VTVADRFETMATAIAASYEYPFGSYTRGEAGNIDEKVRHAITKLADYHFVASENAKESHQVGRDPEMVLTPYQLIWQKKCY
jgi:UDP-N-acetylglucosamine 2-epimerase